MLKHILIIYLPSLDPLAPVISEKKFEMWKANEADDDIKVNKTDNISQELFF